MVPAVKVSPEKLFHGPTPRTCPQDLYLEKESADIIGDPKMKLSPSPRWSLKRTEMCPHERYTEEKQPGAKGPWGRGRGLGGTAPARKPRAAGRWKKQETDSLWSLSKVQPCPQPAFGLSAFRPMREFTSVSLNC